MKKFKQLGVGLIIGLILGVTTVPIVASAVSPPSDCEKTLEQIQETRSFWDFADDQILTSAQRTERNLELAVADRAQITYDQLCVATTTTTAAPTTTTEAPTTTVAPTTTTTAPSGGEAIWSHVDAGTVDNPQVDITVNVPNAGGVSFYENGVYNRTDFTGPADGSVFEFYPAISLDSGDVLRAEWVDASNTPRFSEYVVSGVATTTTAPATTTTTAPPATTTTAPSNTTTTTIPGPVATGLCTGRTASGDVPADAFPHTACTGVVPGTTLTNAGTFFVTTPGAIIENLNVSGSICVQANGVTIRNVRVTGGNILLANGRGWGFCTWDPALGDTARNLTVIDTEIRANDSSALGIEGAMLRGGVTCVRCNIHRVGASINGGFYNLIDTYVHDLLGTGSDPCCWSHNDGFQVGAAGGDVVVRHSNIESNYAPESTGGGMSCAACLYTHGDLWGPMDNVRIENTRIEAQVAGQCIVAGDSLEQDPTNIVFIDIQIFGDCATPVSGWLNNSTNIWSNVSYKGIPMSEPGA